MTRYQDWMRRYIEGQLGFGDEFWKPLADHPGYRAPADRLQELGRDPSEAKYYLTRNLLPDVIHAAGAVEYTAAKIESLLGEAQAWIDVNIELPSAEEWPACGIGFTYEAVDALGFEFGNLVAWGRAVGDRVKRSASGGQGDLGLLPAMNPAHPATDKVRKLYLNVLSNSGILKDVAELAAFSLHGSTLPTRSTKAQITPAGKALISIPDTLVKKIWSPEEFTYEQGRELRTFSQTMLQTTVRFIDALLEIFEAYSGPGRRWLEGDRSGDSVS